MHSKIVFGNNFQGCLDYVFGKADSKWVTQERLVGHTPSQWTQQFNLVANQSQRIQKPVMHVDFSPHPNDHFTDEDGIAFAQEYLKRLGMGNCQWVLARHNDTITPEGQTRPHYHAIANRIPVDQNKAVNSSWIGLRSQQILRELREVFGLTPVREADEIERKAPSVGQERRYRREQAEYEQGKRLDTPDLPIKVQLQNTIDNVTQDRLPLSQFLQHLQQQGIETRVQVEQSGNATGISYSKDGIAFSGTQLGKAYTIHGLQKYRSVDTSSVSERFNKQKTVQSVSSKEISLNQYTDINKNDTPLQQKKQAYQQLESVYGIPTALLQVLEQNHQLRMNAQGKVEFIKTLLGGQDTEDPAFALLTGKRVERAIVTNSPIEAISAFLLEEERQQKVPTLYLSIEKKEELPTQFLSQLEKVVISMDTPKATQEIMHSLEHRRNVSVASIDWNARWLQKCARKVSKQQLEL